MCQGGVTGPVQQIGDRVEHCGQTMPAEDAPA